MNRRVLLVAVMALLPVQSHAQLEASSLEDCYGIDIKSESQIEDSAKPESDDETDIDDDMLVFSEDTDTQVDADEVNE